MAIRLATHKDSCCGEGMDGAYHDFKLKEIDIDIRTMFRYRLREYLFKLDVLRQYGCMRLCCSNLRRPSRIAFGKLRNPPVPPVIPPTEEIEGCGWGFHDYKLSGFNIHIKLYLNYRLGLQKPGLSIDISKHYRCSDCYADMWKSAYNRPNK